MLQHRALCTALLVASSLTTACLLASCATPQASEPVALRLIGINDFHGNLEAANLSLTLADPQGTAAAPGKPVRVAVGGAPALAGLVHTLRDGAPNSLMLSAGDLIGASPLVSTLFKHESTIEVMNAIGLEAGAVGNHEFDAGITELQRIAKGGCAPAQPNAVVTSCAINPYAGARFPLLGANVLDTRGQPVLAPYVVKTYGGISVGVIGAVTKTTPSIVSPSGVAGLTFADEADAVNLAAQQLKARGVKAMVAVFHEGGELGPPQQRGDWNDTRCLDAHGPIFDIAKRLSPDIGVIFSAHTHQGYRCIVDGRVIIQGTSYGRGISVVDVALDPATQNFIPSQTRSINLPVLNERTDPALRERFAAALPEPYAKALRTAQPDAAIGQLVARYSALAAPTAQRPIGSITASFTRTGMTDSAAGRLIADSQLAATKAPQDGGAQIALMNPGGIRSDLECLGTPPCKVSFGQAFTMQPFGNGLVVMTLSGAQLKSLLESQLKSGSDEPTFLQPSAGFSYSWKANAPLGSHVLDMRLNGAPVVPTQPYRITVNSFLAEGGDSFVLLAQGTDRRAGGLDLDALLAYLQTAAVREPSPQPRVTQLP